MASAATAEAASISLGAKSTGDDVVKAFGTDLSGKNVIVTGASSGIGAEAVKIFAKVGANVFAFGRDVDKTQKVIDEIIKEYSDASERLSVIECDLSNLDSVRKAAQAFQSLNIPLHILLNNAGVMAIPERAETSDGFEMQFGTNHIGHFLLTNELLSSLKVGAPSRVVNVSSKAHFRNGINWDDLMFHNSYGDWKVYGQSKTANILHAIGLQSRYEKDGITSVSLHPGVIHTELWRHSAKKYPNDKTIPEGTSTSIYCCVAPDIKGGGYYNNCQEAQPADYACDPANAERLWEVTEAILLNKQ